MDFVDICPPAVVERVRGADLASMDSAQLFDWIEQHSSSLCEMHAVPVIADMVNAATHPSVLRAWLGAVASYGRHFSPEARDRIRRAYLRIPYDIFFGRTYFSGLRRTGIDLRTEIREWFVEDWDFTDPFDPGAATWHYYLYLASLDEPGALDRLAQKIADTSYGNDVGLMLESLDSLDHPGVTDILRGYVDDPRHRDGMEGPGMPISDYARQLIRFRTETE